MSQVKVAVRVRPMNDRERELGCKNVIEMDGPYTIIKHPTVMEGPNAQKVFAFDYSYWSYDTISHKNNYADQQRVFQDLGIDILNNAFEGFNCCIFAYGQTGAGKSYSMLGYGGNEGKGLIPRVCEAIFERLKLNKDPHLTSSVEVSFMEIYNETVKDLLCPKNNKKGGLKVRNHPKTGPYVEDLARLPVVSYEEIERLMDDGVKSRTVAATTMNATSSRSHAVFTIVLTQTIESDAKGFGGRQIVSKIHMVDLAGSERAGVMENARLKEGANINKSLSTLGKVISALAKKASSGQKVFVPYRDSVLTWLLKESLGGNSKTIMLAAISPADVNYEETLSTLRYADSAKKIKNNAIVNEDPTNKLIRELQEELERLRAELMTISKANRSLASLEDANDGNKDRVIEVLQEKLRQNEQYITELNKQWEEKFRDTSFNCLEREFNVSLAIRAVSRLPHLVDLSGTSSTLVHYLEKGETLVGTIVDDGERVPDVPLEGLNIHAEHCLLDHREDGTVWVIPLDGVVFVNGIRVSHSRRLTHGCRVIFGTSHVFRFSHPDEAARCVYDELNKSKDDVVDLDSALSERAAVDVESFFSTILWSDMFEEDKRELEQRFKQFSATKERERDQIQRQLVRLRAQFEQYMLQLEQREMQTNDKSTQMTIIQQKEELCHTFACRYRELQLMKRHLALSIHQQQKTLAHLALQVWNEKWECQRLQERIVSMLSLIDEATTIVEALGIPLYFALELYNSFPEPHIHSVSFSNSIFFGHSSHINVGVRIINTQNKLQFTSDFVAFQERVRLMRELYQAHLRTEVNSRTMVDFCTEASPFYILPQSKRLVGTAHFYLRGLLYLTHITRCVVILDQNGNSQGELTLSVSRISLTRPSCDLDMAGNRDVETGDNRSLLEHTPIQHLEPGQDVEITVRIQSATGLPLDRFTDIACHLTFYDQSFVKTSAGTIQGNVLVFEHSFQFAICNVSEEFISYLQHDALSVELWGQLTISAADAEICDYLRMKDAVEGTDHLLASLTILEPCDFHGGSSDDDHVEFISTTIQRELFAEPSIVFRLHPHHTRRRIALSITSSSQHSPITILGCESAMIGKFLRVNSAFSSEVVTTDQKRMFPLKVLRVTSSTVELEWDMTTMNAPTLTALLLPNSKSQKRGRSQRYRSKKDVMNDIVAGTHVHEKIVGQLEVVLVLAEFSLPVSIVKRIAFKYVHNTGLAHTEFETQLFNQFASKNENSNMSNEDCAQFLISVTRTRYLDVSRDIQSINALIEQQCLQQKRLEIALALSKLRQELDLEQTLTIPPNNNSSSNRQSVMPTFSDEHASQETLLQNISNLEKQLISLTRKDCRQRQQTIITSWLKVQVDEFQVFNFESKKSGFLAKRNRRQEWKMWWFVLSHAYLAYFVRQGDAKPKGLFDLHNVSVTTLPSAQFNTHCFAVVNAARMRLWILQATSAEEMHSWMEAIEPTKKFKETIEWEKKQTKAQIDQAYQEVKAHQEKIIALSKELDAIFEENQALKRQNAELLQAIQEINKTV